MLCKPSRGDRRLAELPVGLQLAVEVIPAGIEGFSDLLQAAVRRLACVLTSALILHVRCTRGLV